MRWATAVGGDQSRDAGDATEHSASTATSGDAQRCSQSRNPEVPESLVVVAQSSKCANAPHSYMKMKQKACQRIGFTSSIEELDESTSQEALIRRITHHAQDCAVDGIIVQLPLPRHINPQLVCAKYARADTEFPT